VDSAVQRQQNEIYEILLLTKYCKYGGLVQLMNDRISVNMGINRLNENEIIHIFCDVCEALSELHYNGIIHRDLKVENILIDDSSLDIHNKRANPSENCLLFNYVLCDFGSCTNKTYDRKLTNSVQIVQAVTDEIQK
jgi:serine/threonine protein kinase